MRLGIQMLNSASTINDLKSLNQVIVYPGSDAVIMFQLVDMDQPIKNMDVYNRYMPLNTATMTVKLFSNNNAKNLQKIPYQPFAQDQSVWQFSLSSAETLIAAGVNMQVTLMEGATTTIAMGHSCIIVNPLNPFRV